MSISLICDKFLLRFGFKVVLMWFYTQNMSNSFLKNFSLADLNQTEFNQNLAANSGNYENFEQVSFY